jgi:hypothetical protein
MVGGKDGPLCMLRQSGGLASLKTYPKTMVRAL